MREPSSSVTSVRPSGREAALPSSRLAPTKSATNGVAGEAISYAGVPSCALLHGHVREARVVREDVADRALLGPQVDPGRSAEPRLVAAADRPRLRPGETR